MARFTVTYTCNAESAEKEMVVLLVVDDEPAITQLLTDVLEYHGHPVMIANDAEAALDILALRRPEMIMVDLMMPGMDGLSLAMALRHHPAVKHVPLVAMSASDSSLDLAARKGDFDAYLSKPFETETLLNLVDRYSKVAS
ncbi:MAG: response regulator [Rhodanobacteraceae bacterium]